jgi:hypothetical protein
MNLEFWTLLEVPKSISGYSGVEFNRNNSLILPLRKPTKKEGLTTESVAPKYRVNDKLDLSHNRLYK